MSFRSVVKTIGKHIGFAFAEWGAVNRDAAAMYRAVGPVSPGPHPRFPGTGDAQTPAPQPMDDEHW